MIISEDVYEIISIDNAAACAPSSLLNDEISVREHQLQANHTWVSEKEDLLKSVYLKYSLPY
jgi:hypothetical protein